MAKSTASLRSQLFGWLLVSLACELIVTGTAAADDPGGIPPLLKQQGLVLVKNQVWVLADEIEMRRLVAEVPLLLDEIAILEKRLQQRRENNALAWKELQPTLTIFKAELGKTATGSAERMALEQKLQQLSTVAVTPTDLGGQSEVRQDLIQFSRRRLALIVRVLALQRILKPLAERYEKLAQQDEVKQQIAQVANTRLGPQRPLSTETKLLTEFEKIAFASAVPLYLQSNRPRVSVLLLEKTPVTVSLTPETGAVSYLPASFLELAGMELPADGAETEITVSPNKRVKVRQIRLEALRIGKLLATDVPIYVLPPAAEDLGGQLSTAFFPGHSLKLEPENLRLIAE